MTKMTGLFFEPRSKLIWEQEINEIDFLPFSIGFNVVMAIGYGNGKYRQAYLIGTL